MQKIKLMVLAILLCSAQIVFAQNGILKGKITQASDNTPLPGTHIYFVGTTLGTAANGDGTYQIKHIKPGEYELIVSFEGLKRIKKQVTIKAGENVMDFAMLPATRRLGEVVVTGTGTAHHLKSAPVPTELISKKDIKAVSATNISDLLINVSPSFDITPGAMGSFLTLNGLDNDFILILVDGKRMYGDIGGNIDLNRLNVGEIEKIEVVKGASSLLYGSNAIAGVVNIITKKSARKINFTNSSRYSKYATFNQSNTLSLNLGRLSSTTSFGFKQSDGWQLSPYERKLNKKTKKYELKETEAQNQAAYKTNTYSQRLSYNVTEKLSVYAEGSYYQNDRYYPQSVKKYGYFYKDINYGAGAKYLLRKRDFISIDYHTDNYKYYYKYNQDYSNKKKKISYNAGDKLKQYDQQMDNVQMKYVHTFSHNNKLTVGADYMNEKMESKGRLIKEKVDAYTLAGYAQEELRFFDNLDIVAGIRVVKHKEFGSNITPKISALYRLNKFNFRGTYGLGFKAPTLKEMYFNWFMRGKLYMGNTNLKPQKSKYASVGAEYQGKHGMISVSIYRNDVDDLIGYKKVALQPGDAKKKIKLRKQHTNISETRAQGIDVIFNAKLGAGFTLGGGYSYVDARDRETHQVLDRVAYHYGNVNLGYAHQWKKYGFKANIIGRMQSKKHYEEDDAAAYNLWKLTTSHSFNTPFGAKLELLAGVDNIFDYVDDAPYGMHHGTINPGRTFFVGININFSK